MPNTMRDLKVELFLADPIVTNYAEPLNVDPERFEFAYTMNLAVSADTSDDDVLEMVFHIFNVNHPADYRHRSLSVGDVVRVDSNRSYICAPIGWQATHFTLQPRSEDSQRTSCQVETGGRHDALDTGR
jgi:hypothetical protein